LIWNWHPEEKFEVKSDRFHTPYFFNFDRLLSEGSPQPSKSGKFKLRGVAEK
jgi:hypothetical protein